MMKDRQKIEVLLSFSSVLDLTDEKGFLCMRVQALDYQTTVFVARKKH